MKISIVTVSYNSEKTIENTIKSILKQKKENIEFIIIDGNSTDQTINIINQYKTHIDFIIHEKDKGISDAFNKGINLATGDIIGIVNSDDLLYPNTIDVLEREYSENIDVYYGDALIYDTSNKMQYIRKALPLETFKNELPFIHQSCWISKNAYRKWGTYSLKYNYCMDYELLYKMYINKAKFKYIAQTLCEFHYGGTSYNHPFKTLNEINQIKKQYGINWIDRYKHNIKYVLKVCIKRTLTKTKVLKIPIIYQYYMSKK